MVAFPVGKPTVTTCGPWTIDVYKYDCGDVKCVINHSSGAKPEVTLDLAAFEFLQSLLEEADISLKPNPAVNVRDLIRATRAVGRVVPLEPAGYDDEDDDE
jgi:hypothetical protein